ncbi:unnamed protein product [Rangifer tarandus platyrhynchus]|uniref:Uncharacterized protein n=2 Tax=Rangifer tarandus platyrhynchus TaxID=3082113 RepID=A0ABN8Y1W1_RANTA|nr:unnamed protein product [Rangifer tarandus platyrhynchus]
MPGPIPAPDSQGPRLTSPPWGELSAARILASTDPGEPSSGMRDLWETDQSHGSSPFEENKSKLQDIIPQPLLDQYVSMTDPARVQTVNTNIAKHCACSLPGGGTHPGPAELALPERYAQDAGLRRAGKRSLCRGWHRTAN